MRIRSLVFTLALASGACGDDGAPGIRSTPPTAPATNDPAYAITGARQWYLVDDALTKGPTELALTVTAPAGIGVLDAWIVDSSSTAIPVRLAASGAIENAWDLKHPTAGLAPGTYTVIIAPDNGDAVAKLTFQRSHAYYVLVTTDWDFAEPGQAVLNSHTGLHTNHPGMKITHFPGPYSFTESDAIVTPARKQELAAWLNTQASMWGDEIGLHIHPYCHFVTTAGVACVTDQSTTMATDTSGYTIKLGAYNRADFGKLLDRSHELFAMYGLPRPKTFRAGGWTATIDTIRALDDKGYVADTSALHWATIAEEWAGSELLRWNMENWAPINETSQPYHPSETDVLAPGNLAILEVPDNGTMIDYVTVQEMKEIFDANYMMGTPLAKPTTLMMGFHPATPGFSEAEYLRVDGFLDYSDLHLAAKDAGPVVYATLSDVATVFPRP